jgi:hypothetical protein
MQWLLLALASHLLKARNGEPYIIQIRTEEARAFVFTYGLSPIITSFKGKLLLKKGSTGPLGVYHRPEQKKKIRIKKNIACTTNLPVLFFLYFNNTNKKKAIPTTVVCWLRRQAVEELKRKKNKKEAKIIMVFTG